MRAALCKPGKRAICVGAETLIDVARCLARFGPTRSLLGLRLSLGSSWRRSADATSATNSSRGLDERASRSITANRVMISTRLSCRLSLVAASLAARADCECTPLPIAARRASRADAYRTPSGRPDAESAASGRSIARRGSVGSGETRGRADWPDWLGRESRAQPTGWLALAAGCRVLVTSSVDVMVRYTVLNALCTV